MNEENLTEREAYEAMCEFLEAYWERGGKESDDLAVLLGSAVLNADGRPLDPAQWHDWIKAADKVRARRTKG